MREHTDGDFPFANDFNAIVDAISTGTHVVAGCAVSGGTAAGMNVDITAGSVAVDGDGTNVTAQTVTIPDADPDHDRYDLLVVGTDGTVDVVAGVASSTPTAPSIPTGHVLLAIVGVTAGATEIGDGAIYGVGVDRGVVVPGFPTYDDLPTDRDTFGLYWVEDEAALYIEDGQ